MLPVTIASLNTHWGVEPGGRPYDALGVITGLDADIICLQECWRHEHETGFAGEAAAALGFHLHQTPLARGVFHGHTWGKGPPDGAHGAWGIAVLTRFPSHNPHRIDLGRMPFDPANRAALQVDVDVAPGVSVSVTVAHLSHRPYGSLAQLHRLRAHLPDPSTTTAIVAGDLNMWGPPVRSILRRWRRAVRGRTWPAHRPHSQIDHILVSRTVAVVGGGVLDRCGSDHRPVRTSLLLPLGRDA